MEKRGIEEHTAMFQLRKHLEWCKATLIDDSMSLNRLKPDPLTVMAHDDAIEIEGSAVCEGKSDMGNAKLCTRFGHFRTHSEQLCVVMCGVIFGRATFYGLEAVNGVRVGTSRDLC